MSDETKPQIVDADVFDPIPTRRIKIGGVEYRAFSCLQVPYNVYLQAMRVDEHIQSKTDTEAIDFFADLILEFVPSLTREELFNPKGKKQPSILKLGALVGLLAAPPATPDGETPKTQDQPNP